ncbi:pathogen-related protein-like [Thalassophryne amazonica]|uniref:pathogen-related protein-like n=1 Tax=Thalassophryne amazonica TaxID=390379 RepID=UPI001472696F|nr:pathogen-related protein-like [Thalassophryne amazonica]
MSKASPEPERMFMDDPNIKWRTKRPDFSKVNKKYLEGKTRSHPKGSLEETVENLVKTFEMEASHKIDPKDWGSVDPDKFELCTNGGKTYTLADVIEKGTYNLFLDENPLYTAQETSFEQSMDLFKGCFTDGFAWELLDLYGALPVLTFTWRHWSNYTGPYRSHPPTGETLEVYGSAIVTVDEHLRITRLEMYFDFTPMLSKLNHVKCPLFK